ncbi:MAG TPA: heat-inducible transcriptional repressor HrcA [Acidimicrobiales bacterium]|nr:heat-inducible transcriptional repressor HrcA [Acidimicrobiales bacterium]
MTRQPSTSRHRAAEAELDARKAAILEAVVTEYIGTAQPVGSQHVAAAPGVSVSSATIRSEMVALEHEGFLVQPHTSAGRIPTDKGYRFFVDHLAEPGLLGPAHRQKVRRFFDQMHGEMEEMLERTSGLLSELTECAAVVMGPSHESVAAIRSVQVVGLAPRLGLLVVVLADGSVEKGTLELDRDIPDERWSAATAHLQPAVQGWLLGDPVRVGPSGDEELDRLVATATGALAALGRSEENDHVFVGGPSRLAAAFDAVETVRSVLSILEQQLVVVSLLRDVLDRGLSVAIGTEHGYEPLASCAVVVAPLTVDGHSAGAVGLLGPTRMNYPQALAAAHLVGEQLGERIGGTLGVPAERGRTDAADGPTASAGGRRRSGEPKGGRGGQRGRG